VYKWGIDIDLIKVDFARSKNPESLVDGNGRPSVARSQGDWDAQGSKIRTHFRGSPGEDLEIPTGASELNPGAPETLNANGECVTDEIAHPYAETIPKMSTISRRRCDPATFHEIRTSPKYGLVGEVTARCHTNHPQDDKGNSELQPEKDAKTLNDNSVVHSIEYQVVLCVQLAELPETHGCSLVNPLYHLIRIIVSPKNVRLSERVHTGLRRDVGNGGKPSWRCDWAFGGPSN
jgi:hypothetical protein